MEKTKWERFKKSFMRNFMSFLMIFAAEDEFIHKHRNKSSQIKELDRYGNGDKEKDEK